MSGCTPAPQPTPETPDDPPACGWDAVAAGWARWWDVIEGAAAPLSARLLDLAAVAPGQTVLDLATGLGEPAISAARRVGPRGRVIATDVAPAMLRRARQRVAEQGLTNIEVRFMDAGEPDLAAASVDAILCRWGLMFVPDLEHALVRLRALLRPDGRLAAAIWPGPEAVPLIGLSRAVLAARVPVPEEPGGIDAFSLSEPGLLEDRLRRAGFAAITREELALTYEFASAEAYTRFRREATLVDAGLALHHPPAAIESAWQAVTEAARGYADADGRVRLVNTAVCVAARR